MTEPVPGDKLAAYTAGGQRHLIEVTAVISHAPEGTYVYGYRLCPARRLPRERLPRRYLVRRSMST